MLKFVAQLAAEKRLDREFIVESIKEVLEKITKEELDEKAKLKVIVYETTGAIKVYLMKKIVKTVKKPFLQIPLKEAQKIKPTYKLGEEIRTPFPFESLSRNSIIRAKNMLLEKLREKEKEMVREKYTSKIGDVVSGVVYRVDKYEVIIKLEGAEGFLPLREQIPNEKYFQGNPLKAYIINITPGGRLLLSRTHPDFLRRLFFQEVPEIKEKLVEIKMLARLPGIRAKVVVNSISPHIDPVGTCIGMKGTRIRSILKELGNEKIDVIPYSEDKETLLSNILGGIEILKYYWDEAREKITIVVKDEDLPKAIGKNGVNVTLASKLLVLKVDILSLTEYKDKGIALLKGISKETKNTLIKNGFFTARDVLERGIEGLQELGELEEEEITKVFEVVKKLVEQ